MPDSIRHAIEQKDIQFQRLFTRYQSNVRMNLNYLSFDAFRDLKIIFDLYAETFHLKGFNYNHLNVSDINKLISGFDNFQKKELVGYLIKSLAKNGIDNKARELFTLLSKLEILCAWEGIIRGSKFPSNFLKLIHHLVAYNKFTLFLSPILFALFSSILYLEAPFKFMEVINIEKRNICDNFYWNHFANVLIYIFDDKMLIIPMNFNGVILMIVIKSFLILIVVNFFLKELFNRIKLI